MAKNRSIHDLIEEQEPESKRRMKKKLDQYFTDDDLFDTEVAAKKPFQWKKFTSIAVAFILVIGIALFSVFYFQPKGPKSRYCTQEEYTVEERTETIKEHAASLQKNWLYLDWYDVAESVKPQIYYLDESGDEICYSEEIINGETGDLVLLYVTDNFTQIDILEVIKNKCISSTQIKSCEILYDESNLNSVAYFKFKDNSYFVKLQQPSYVTILDVVEEMLP